MSGIYVHIPYCKQACHYCNFHFSTNLNSISEMADSIEKEISMRSAYLKDPVTTIYFGGGTPSLLDPVILENILKSLNTHFEMTPSEITLECNPDDINKTRLNQWRNIGINRLSIGIQCLQDEHLIWMNRSHNSKEALSSLELVGGNGFDNISIDLIYGFDGLSDDQLYSNLETVCSYGIAHISAYALTVESKTALFHQVKNGNYTPPKDTFTTHQMKLIIDFLEDEGYEHYEISNYAKPGRRAIHNTNYWSGIPYLGVGPGAHSYNGHSRQWNISHNVQYIKGLQSGIIPFEDEVLSIQDQYNEYIMVHLRTANGVSLNQLRQKFPKFEVHFLNKIKPYLQQHVLERKEIYTLTLEGKFMADRIASELFSIT